MRVAGALILLVAIALGSLWLPGLAGQLAVYPWLGLFPGLALAHGLAPRERLFTKIAIAFALSPPISCMAGWLLVRAGLGFGAGALLISVAGGLACAGSLLARRPTSPDPPLPVGAKAWAIATGVALIAVPALNPYLYLRSDAWLHGGIVMELLERGFPPQDPRMAGIPLNYVWFFNLFVALLTGLRNQDPFRFMFLFNGATGFATVALVALIAGRLWKDRRAPVAAAALLTLGLNAGAYLLWPLNLGRAWAGSVRGLAEVLRQLKGIEFGTVGVLYSLNAPFSEMVSFLDKLLVGTALGFGYLEMTLFLWAVLSWLEDRRRSALAWVAVSGAGMMFFHSVVGLSVIPLALIVLSLAWLMQPRWSWLPPRGALAAVAGAAAAGAAVALPYLRSITAGWHPDRAGFQLRFLEFNPTLPWTLLTACFFPLWFARRPVAEAWAARRTPQILLAAFAGTMAIFASAVHLPEGNAVKFVYEFFTACVPLATPAFVEWVARGWRERRVVTVTVLFACFAVPTLLTLHGYLVDPTGQTRAELHPRPGEEAVYRWMRDQTPRDAVVVDRDFRDLAMVLGRRRLFLGTTQPPDLAAFPAREMQRRQRVMADLFGPLSRVDSTVAGLRSTGAPTYVLYRPEDPPLTTTPWQRLMEAAPGSRLVYDSGGYRVVQLSPRSAS
jgi:hypothetical protein